MGDYLSFFDGLLARLQGPMNIRFLIQPLVAVFFAFMDALVRRAEATSVGK